MFFLYVKCPNYQIREFATPLHFALYRLLPIFRDVSFQTLGIKLIKYSVNMDKISIVSKDRLDNSKGLDNPSLTGQQNARVCVSSTTKK